MKIVVVLLTWQRINTLKNMLTLLARQTYSDFSVHISNGNLEQRKLIDKYAQFAKSSGKLDVTVSHDGNDLYTFRRFAVGERLAKQGADVIFFLDDDVLIGPRYIEYCIKQYEPETYASGFAWRFDNGGRDYYKHRTRIYNNTDKIHYCGTGVSMIDAKIFLQKGLQTKAPKEAYKIEDLWLSYYAQHVMKWKLKYLKMSNVKIGGGDKVALYRQVARESFNKSDLLRMLIKKYRWKI